MKEYVLTVGGIDHTVLMDEDEARDRKLRPAPAKAVTPANKARTTQVQAK